MWKRKIRDLVDYHEGALGAIDGKLVKSGALAADGDDKMVKYQICIEKLNQNKTIRNKFNGKNRVRKVLAWSAIEIQVVYKQVDRHPLSWLNHRQGAVATSTAKAELVAANEAFKEIVWLNRFSQSRKGSGYSNLKNR
ncbi:hypothetical protein GWI33_019511 [Rhynchophorus ferrugineus]|uniref:Uncharacterized protein n=1 Tax=Rhynchophorus ferrugineus TaxID=354439 RepID=A0A834HY70_RHYFE|nr:hypothetical protein GWI33_019511 [Rhynchophorus ferrugineus]